MWPPIALENLYAEINKTEHLLEKELRNFWKLIKVEPVKWSEKEFGADSDGFWVIAICGKRIIWYNDIEEGFTISNFDKFGEIDNYNCDDFELNQVVWQLYNIGNGESLTTEKPSKTD